MASKALFLLNQEIKVCCKSRRGRKLESSSFFYNFNFCLAPHLKIEFLDWAMPSHNSSNIIFLFFTCTQAATCYFRVFMTAVSIYRSTLLMALAFLSFSFFTYLSSPLAKINSSNSMSSLLGFREAHLLFSYISFKIFELGLLMVSFQG